MMKVALMPTRSIPLKRVPIIAIAITNKLPTPAPTNGITTKAATAWPIVEGSQAMHTKVRKTRAASSLCRST